MKKYILLILVLFNSVFILDCNAKNICTTNNAIIKKEYFSTGELERKVYLYKYNNKCTIYYYKNGNKESETSYRNGIVDGVSKGYYSNGKIKIKVKVKKSSKEQFATTYYKSGNIKSTFYSKNGKQNGKSKLFYETGELKLIVNYVNDMENGDSFVYSKDGTIESKTIYKNGKIIKYFSKNELIKLEPDECRVSFVQGLGDINCAVKYEGKLYVPTLYIYNNILDFKLKIKPANFIEKTIKGISTKISKFGIHYSNEGFYLTAKEAKNRNIKYKISSCKVVGKDPKYSNLWSDFYGEVGLRQQDKDIVLCTKTTTEQEAIIVGFRIKNGSINNMKSWVIKGSHLKANTKNQVNILRDLLKQIKEGYK